jgi:beta-glucosidase
MSNVDRRALLLGAGLAAGAATTAQAAAKPSAKKPGFLWGSAGAAYQIEGGNVASDLWVMEHVKQIGRAHV